MKISIFAGDITDAPAEALCTSTNPRLSLVMGTGASVRARGGFEILRECERIVEAERQTSGKAELPPGSVHVTTAGALPAKIVIHCVASGAGHRTSEAIVAACVTGALARAAEAGCRSIALPLFGTGHASFPLDRSTRAIIAALAAAPTAVEQAWIVAQDEEVAGEVRAIVRSSLPGVDPEVIRSPSAGSGPASFWDDEE